MAVLRPHLHDAVPLVDAAEKAGIPIRTARRWLARYRADGPAGLARPPRPEVGTRTFPKALVEPIEGMALAKPPPSIATIHRRLAGLDCVHAALTVQLGIGQLGSSSTPADDRFAAYDWSVGLASGPNTFLLHDPTDEIALPIAEHKHPVASENGFGEQCAGRVSHLFGHYYRCTF